MTEYEIMDAERQQRMRFRLANACMLFIDRANDVSEQDPAERILSEWAAAVNKILEDSDK